MVMFEFLDGYHAKVDKNNLPTKDQAYAAGRVFASMHEIGKTFKPSSSRSRNTFMELERVLQNKKRIKLQQRRIDKDLSYKGRSQTRSANRRQPDRR